MPLFCLCSESDYEEPKLKSSKDPAWKGSRVSPTNFGDDDDMYSHIKRRGARQRKGEAPLDVSVSSDEDFRGRKTSRRRRRVVSSSGTNTAVNSRSQSANAAPVDEKRTVDQEPKPEVDDTLTEKRDPTGGNNTPSAAPEHVNDSQNGDARKLAADTTSDEDGDDTDSMRRNSTSSASSGKSQGKKKRGRKPTSKETSANAKTAEVAKPEEAGDGIAQKDSTAEDEMSSEVPEVEASAKEASNTTNGETDRILSSCNVKLCKYTE